MPRVPTSVASGLGTISPNARPTPFFHPDTHPDMFGAGKGRQWTGIGQSLEKLSDGMMDVAKDRQRETSTRVALEKEDAWRTFENDTLWGENGAYRRKGGDALGAAKELETNLRQFLGTLMKDADAVDQGARLKMESHFSARAAALIGDVRRYEAGEEDNHVKGLLGGRVSNAIEDAALYYTDARRVGESRSKIHSAAQSLGARFGWAGEETQAYIADKVSAMHKGIVNRMLANNDGLAAQDYLTRAKAANEIAGDDVAKLESAVKSLVDLRTADAEATRLFAKYGTNSESALAEARTIQDLGVQDVVVSRVKTRIAEREHAEQEADKEVKLNWSQNFNEATIRAHRGELTYSDIEDMQKKGKLDPDGGHRRALTLTVDDVTKKRRKELDGIARVVAAQSGAGVLDPRSADDREAVDAAFRAKASAWSQQRGMTAADYGNLAFQFASSVGIIPETMKGQIRGFLRSGTPQQKVAAADMVERLRMANPQMVGDFSDDDVALGSMIAARASAGIPAAEAVRTSEEALRVPKAERDARAAHFKDLIRKDGGSERTLRDMSGNWLVRNLPGVSNPAVPQAMVDDLDTLTGQNYEMTGDLDRARKLAVDRLKSVWGVTHVAGETRYMKYAPELFYGRPDLDPDSNATWMREQLVSDLKSGGMVDETAGPIENRARVIPNPIRPFADDGRPLYSVITFDRNGVMNTVLGSDGMPLAWRPDWPSSAEAKRRAEKQAKTVNDAKMARGGRKNPAQLTTEELQSMMVD